MKLTTHLHLLPRSRMREAIPLLPQYVFMTWCLVKHRDNFNFYYFIFIFFPNRCTFYLNSGEFRSINVLGAQMQSFTNQSVYLVDEKQPQSRGLTIRSTGWGFDSNYHDQHRILSKVVSCFDVDEDRITKTHT
jgi:hypothetical protein